ncbi:terpenoid synthase [Macroventuria anomochaeta]|uniref:Terpenoid synthase n=1 Tax=Macroventuria anomochaeta TaxID=301207 RepID=A0ACB6SAB5_9PLEO|nr:terpenoid synthase [Macroventuria anomochaeta]KAF2630913.1 terpenoid synthase [Macroventuria anomochaeta]
MAYESSATRELLLESLKGMTLAIPDLKAMIAHWPASVNLHKNLLRDEVHERFERLFPPGKRLQKMKLADAALFGSSWWPYASFEDLCVVTHLSTWLFAWDDELDSAEYSNLINDMDQATTFREYTIRYIRACLNQDYGEPIALDSPIITDITRVCEAVRQGYPPEKTQIFLNELVYFVESCQLEQQNQVEGHLPTAQEYLQRRMGSGAVRVCLALSEFACRIVLPSEIMADPDMTTIWDATNIVICIMNDILSFKKELAQGQVDSILPVLFAEHGSMDTAMSIAASLIVQSIRSVDDAAERLLQRHGEDLILRRDLGDFIDSCKYACTGNLNWSLVSGRFQICQTTTTDGILVTLAS